MREIRAIRRLTRRYGAATDSLIESGSEVVEGVGGSEPKIAGQWVRKLETGTQPPRVAVLIGPHTYEVLPKGVVARAEIRDMFIGPCDL